MKEKLAEAWKTANEDPQHPIIGGILVGICTGVALVIVISTIQDMGFSSSIELAIVSLTAGLSGGLSAAILRNLGF